MIIIDIYKTTICINYVAIYQMNKYFSDDINTSFISYLYLINNELKIYCWWDGKDITLVSYD